MAKSKAKTSTKEATKKAKAKVEEVSAEVEETVSEAVELIDETLEDGRGRAVELFNNMTGLANKVYLAGLGAVVTAQEEAFELVKAAREDTDNRFGALRENSEKLTNQFVERGESFHTDNITRINEMIDERRNTVGETVQTVSTKANDTFNGVMGRLNIPTADSVDALNKQIGSLGRKIDNLRKSQNNAA